MIYVNPAIELTFGLQVCHLIADSEDELHAFAQSLGLSLEAFQDGTLPRYDLINEQRDKALDRGAIEISTGEFYQRLTAQVRP